MKVSVILCSLWVVCSCGEKPSDFDPGDTQSATDTAESVSTDGTDTESESETGNGTDAHFDTDPDTGIVEDSEDMEVDTGTETDTSTKTDTETATEIETETDTDIYQTPTACEQAAEMDSAMICCGANPPTDCSNSSWSWSPKDRVYGCCTEDLAEYVFCEQKGIWSLQKEPCPGLCRVRSEAKRSLDDLDCAPIPGYDCEHPVHVNTFPFDWVSLWSNFGYTFNPLNECGSGDLDIWVRVVVKAGKKVTIQEKSLEKVVLRRVSSCQSSKCSEYTDEQPETLDFVNSSDSEVIVIFVVSRALNASTVSLRIEENDS